MKILSDGIVFQNNFQRGIQRYFYELFGRLARDHEIELYLTAPAVVPLPAGVKLTLLQGLLPRPKWNMAGRLIRQVRRHRALRMFQTKRYDLFHSTYFTRSPIAGLPEIVTVYDMLLEDFAGAFDWKWRLAAIRPIAQKRRCVIAARRVISISHATKLDVERCIPQARGKVHPIHLGSEHLRSVDVAEVQRPESFILMVGQRTTYKNFEMLLEAMRRPEWPGGMNMVVAGSPLTAAENAKIASLGLTACVEGRGFVSDAELSDLYTRATCFVFPSLAEGFGFPLIEAQCRRTAVACSDIAVFREMAGEGALYFDPRSAEAIARVVGTYREPRLRSDLIERGFVNSRRFSWDKCAAETLAVYRDVIGLSR